MPIKTVKYSVIFSHVLFFTSLKCVWAYGVKAGALAEFSLNNQYSQRHLLNSNSSLSKAELPTIGSTEVWEPDGDTRPIPAPPAAVLWWRGSRQPQVRGRWCPEVTEEVWQTVPAAGAGPLLSQCRDEQVLQRHQDAASPARQPSPHNLHSCSSSRPQGPPSQCPTDCPS